jgi:hypothetical protein
VEVLISGVSINASVDVTVDGTDARNGKVLIAMFST